MMGSMTMPGGKAQKLGSWRVGGYLVEYEGGFTYDVTPPVDQLRALNRLFRTR